jgi:hypothetical protein
MPLWTRVILVNSGLPAWSPQLPAGLVIDANPCEKGGRLYNASRSDRVWSDENEAAFMRVASEPLRLYDPRAIDRPASGRPIAVAMVRL